MRWLIAAATNRNDKSMASRLGRELIDASNNEGGAVRKKDDTHRMAEANKAFSHFRF
jgi:small subunit ribosomal protein S7